MTRLNRERGITVIVITHDASVAGYARRVVTFADGRIATDVEQPPAGVAA